VITNGQVSAGTVASTLTVLPPGPCHLVVSNPSASVIVYVGAGTVTTGNGLPVPAGQSVAVAGFQGDGGARLSVIAASGTANAVGWMLSTATGGTGP
jgi:hypothetical protein